MRLAWAFGRVGVPEPMGVNAFLVRRRSSQAGHERADIGAHYALAVERADRRPAAEPEPRASVLDAFGAAGRCDPEDPTTGLLVRVEGNLAASSRTMHSAVERIEECDLTWGDFRQGGEDARPGWLQPGGRIRGRCSPEDHHA
jgi:hypothetical protein